MLFRQRFKPVAYSVEFLNFVQDCNRMHWVRAFPESLSREHLRWADLVERT